MNFINERASYQAAFAFDVITAAGALGLLILATRPTFKRIKARRFSAPGSKHGSHDGPFKTTLGTYLFLWPALFCLFAAYTARFIQDLLITIGTVNYDDDLVWNGRTSYSINDDSYATSVSALSFLTALATIFFTVLLNGGVWIHSSHVQENGTGIATPRLKSKIWNTLIMLVMLGTGVAAWATAMSIRKSEGGSSGSSSMLSWSDALQYDLTSRIILIVHEAIVVAASLSVTIEVLNEYNTTNKNARRSSERTDLVRFTFVVVPLIWLRDAFIMLDIILLYVDTAAWSDTSKVAMTFLLIVFRQIANLAILAMVLWGAWRMEKSVGLFSNSV